MTALAISDACVIQGREAAQARALAYALFADLMASPQSDTVSALPPVDLTETLASLTSALPYSVDFSALRVAGESVADQEATRLQSEYATLFEAGQGAGTVREEIARNLASGAKEEVVRFYAHFGYALSTENRWQADHLAFELEFLHFLCVLEANEGDLSIALAERDFLSRHPADWWPMVLRGLTQAILHPWHRALFTALDAFLRADLEWQNARLEGVA